MKVPVVLLQSYPRSGNTLVRHVIDDMFGVPTFTVYRGEDATLWPGRTVDRVDGVPVAFIKTHHDRDYSKLPHKVIYIVRDGRDTLLSQAHYSAIYPKRNGIGWRNILASLVSARPTSEVHKDSVAHWGEHVETLWDKADARIRFEDLLEDPLAVVRKALWKVGVLQDMPDPLRNRMPDFETLHKRRPDFYRKGTTGQWREEFPAELLDEFWENHGRAMEIAGYASSPVLV